MTELTILQFGAVALLMTSWMAIFAYAGLRGWNGWLALKHAELQLASGQQRQEGAGGASVATATRIDVADLKERIRKLEAIAAGIDV